MEVVKDICDRVAIIENGQIIEMNKWRNCLKIQRLILQILLLVA